MSVPALLHIVTLGVEDLVRSRAFYADLGWEEASSSMDEICWFRTGGCYIGLFPRDELANDAGVPPTKPGGFSGVTLAMDLADEAAVDAALGAAARAGATIVKPARKMDWGGYSGYFADPDGFLWEVAHNPFFTLDDEGRLHIP